MMKRIGFIVSFVTSTISLAKPDLSPKDIAERLSIKAEIFVLDSSGKRLLQESSHDSRYEYGVGNKIDSFMSNEGADYGLIALHHKWEVRQDGSIAVSIEEFAHRYENPQTGREEFKDSIKKDTFVIENFSGLVWKVQNNREKNVVVRFTPSLTKKHHSVALKDFPLSGSSMVIIDRQGTLWADELTLQGQFWGITTHRGSLVLSYQPFHGAKVLGLASGNQIDLDLDSKIHVKVVSKTDFLPNGVEAKVFGFYLPNKKTASVMSVQTSSTDKEEKILEYYSPK